MRHTARLHIYLCMGSYSLPLWFWGDRERPCSAISPSSSAASQPVMNEARVSDQYYLWGITGRPDSHTWAGSCSLCMCASVHAWVTHSWCGSCIRGLLLVSGLCQDGVSYYEWKHDEENIDVTKSSYTNNCLWCWCCSSLISWFDFIGSGATFCCVSEQT